MILEVQDGDDITLEIDNDGELCITINDKSGGDYVYLTKTQLDKLITELKIIRDSVTKD